jgi:hypothetical protein
LHARAQEVTFSSDGGHLVSAGTNGGITFWALQTKQPLVGLYFFGDRDWVAVAPDGLFDGTADAMQQVSWRVGSANEVISLDSFYNDFYHPGLVAEITEGGRPRARPDIAGVLQLPGLRAMLMQGLARFDSREGTPVLCFPERPTAAPQIFADAQPLALSVEDLTFDEDDPACPWRRELPAGRQYEVVGGSGSGKSESPRLSYDGAKSGTESSVLHVQTIGVSEYDLASSGLKPLPASSAGAKEVEKYFVRQQKNAGKLYRRVRVWEGLYDQRATRDGIRRRFAEMAGAMRGEDVVFLFLSGHGLVPAGQEMFYFAPADMRGPSPQDERETGLNTAMLAEAMRELPARRVVLIIDACQSGGAIESLSKIAQAKASVWEREMRAAESHKRRGPRPDTGVYVIAAATPLQQAVQPVVGNGALVTTLLEALAATDKRGDGRVWLRDVVRQVQRRLPEVSREIGLSHTPMFVSAGVDFPIGGKASVVRRPRRR